VKSLKVVDKPVLVTVANGSAIPCTHELSKLLWSVQGHTFKNTLKVLPLNCNDILLGMDWLSTHSPMEIHWADKWLQFNYQGQSIKLQGIQPQATLGSPISVHQLQAMQRKDSILYMV